MRTKAPMTIKFGHNKIVTDATVKVGGFRCPVIDWGRGECIAVVPVDLKGEVEKMNNRG